MRARLFLPAACAALAVAARAQDAKPAAPPAQVKVLQAVVMEVKGTAQARRAAKEAWRPLKVNDVVNPGAEIRTGRESSATLRVGMNCTIRVDRQSRVALPSVVQDGAVLRTRVAMTFGKADIKVDRVGLDNDFEVATPTATLAVRGTGMRVGWDPIHGVRAEGVEGNALRAVEVRYLHDLLALLSGADGTSDTYKLPALDAYGKTLLILVTGPGGTAGFDPSELEWFRYTPDRHPIDPIRDTGLEVLHQMGGSRGQQGLTPGNFPVDSVPP
ncbi:MAG: FecR domain-containing protein [Planctomycetota bacterium]